MKSLTVIDVGSLGGKKAPLRHLPHICFEPQDEPIAIGAQYGHGTLYVTKHPDASSLLKPNDAFLREFLIADRYAVVEEVPVTIRTLDELITVPGPFFLKIDTQGTELDVLRGANRVLEEVIGIDIEVNFAPRYVGQCFFSDVDAFARNRGFQLFDLQRRFLKRSNAGGPKGQLTHATALYLRTLSPRYRDELAHIASLYGYDDYADVLKGTASPIWIDGMLPRFPLRFALHRALSKASLLFKPRSYFGTSGDETLGN